MTRADTVGGDERLRLFLALRLPEAAVDAIEAWQRQRLRQVRVVPREQLHVTLAFLGSRPAAELGEILAVLRAAAARAAGEIRFTPLRYRETRSVGMLVLEDEGGRAGELADDIHSALERLGVYRREGRPWLPHVTVARFSGRRLPGARPGAKASARPTPERARKRPPLRLEPLKARTFVPSDAAAYLSRLQPGGAQYEVLEAVALGRTGIG
jgi:2'-5' RNA ligase